MPIDPNQVQWDESPQIETGAVQWEPTGEPAPTELSTKYAQYRKKEEPGIADMLFKSWERWKEQPERSKAGTEIAAQMATGAVAEPVAGLAGIAGSVLPGEGGQSAQWVEKTREALTYQPGEQAQQGMQKVAENVMALPGAETIMAIPEKIGDLSYEGALKLGMSPETAAFFGAAGKSALPVAMELLGFKGTKAAKKGLLKKVMEKAEKTDFYDEMGQLKREVKDALKNADIDPNEVADILPESITTMEAAKPIAEQIKGAKVTRQYRAEGLAEKFKPNIEKIKAFEESNVEYLPQFVSDNPTANAIAENLSNIPGSMMAPKKVKMLEQLGQRADDIIKEGGGTLAKGELNTRYLAKANEAIDSLYKSSSELYDEVGKKMPAKSQIETDNIREYIKQAIIDQGGEENLSALEKMLMKKFASDKKVTYGHLDRMRRVIGEKLGKADTTFRNVDKKVLGDIYDIMTNDQETALLRHGNEDLLKTYLTGKEFTKQRKGIERQLENTLGRKLVGNLPQKMGSAVKSMAKGDTRTFDEMLANIPKTLGTELRRDIVVSAMNDAFTAGSRAKGQISVGGFGSWWDMMQRQPQAIAKLKKEVGLDTWNKIETLAKVNKSIKETMDLSQKTGRIISTPGLFDEVNGIAARAYGKAQRTAARTPVVGGLFEDILTRPKNARSIAADKLLSDQRFLNLLKEEAMGKINTAPKRANIDKMVNKIKAYQDWKKTLSGKELSDLAAVGALGYLSGRAQTEEKQVEVPGMGYLPESAMNKEEQTQ